MALLAAGGRSEEREQVEALADFLEYQPAALEHAAVYLLEMPAVGCAEYLDLMQRDAQYRPRGIDGQFPDAEYKAIDSTSDWLVGEADLREPRFLAKTLFNLLCQPDPAGIPERVAVSRPVFGWLTLNRDIEGARGAVPAGVEPG